MNDNTPDKNTISTILVADDKLTMRQALEELLTIEGYRVACASNGTEVLTKAKQIIPDLILLDVMMPDIDGLEACRRLRTDPLLAEVPIIVVTALANRASRLEAFEAGADDFVSKPIDDIELLARVRTTTRLNRYRKLLSEQYRRRQVEEELRQRNRELTALNAIASAINRSRTLQEKLNAALEETLATLDVEGGLIYLVDRTTQTLKLAVHRGLSPAVLQEIDRPKINERTSGPATPTIQALFVPDREDCCSLVNIPLKAQDKTMGVMTLVSRRGDQFRPDSLSMLMTIGHQVSVAIDNVRLMEEASEVEILQEVDRLRSELIANVSHELRTPLGLIKVFCTTLLREDVDFNRQIQREFLHDIDEETDRLENIVDNLLDLSRMESERLHLNKQPTDLALLSKEIIETMKVDIEPVQHRFICDFPSDPLIASVDSKYIEQVLRNLLSNATKYSPQEGGAITVGGRGNDRQTLIWVSDQGIGIPSEDLQRIFERFYRVENESTQNVRGTGLGLAVCRGIVEAHGGRIWAESTLGVGSTFYFTLPHEECRVYANQPVDAPE